MTSFWGELKRRNVVRVAIAYAIVSWLLLQMADVVLDNIEAPTWVFQAILLLLVIGFPVAIIFAWAFELTPEGIKKEKDVDRSESITHITGRKLDFAIIGVLAITVVYFVAEQFFWADDRATESQVNASIAVLPFVPLSSGEDDGYFADGLTEEILNALTQIPELQVTARTSSFFFKGQNIPVPEIATRLNVAHVVEGSVRRDGDRVRITAQLIHASSDRHLWSQTYDRTFQDIFAIQQDIAENIAEALNVVLDNNARRDMRNAGINDVEAFIAYQKGLEAYATAHRNVRDASKSLVIANAYFDQALEVAPHLTSARLMKADRAGHALIEIAIRQRDEEYPGEAREVLAALREEYDLARLQSPPGAQRDILDLERTLFSDDWSRLPEQIQKAMQPGGCPEMNWTREFIAPFGWSESLLEKIRERIACNPVTFSGYWALAQVLIWAGDPEGALQIIDEAENKGASNPWLEVERYAALLAAGRVDDEAVRGPGQPGSYWDFDRQIFWQALAGDPAVARQMVEEYWSRPDANDWSSLVLAAVVGDREQANGIAARIDMYPGSAVVLNLAIIGCYCGAPFDLEAVPNYKARIEEAGFPWPPTKHIDYPSKTW
jgi:TolB-like protein